MNVLRGSMPLVSLNNVWYAYPSSPSAHVLQDVSCHVAANDVVQVVGRNGSGKSTLLRILAADLQPTRGTRTAPHARAVYLDQNADDALGLDLTVRDQLFLAEASGHPYARAPFDAIRWEVLLNSMGRYGLGLEHRLNAFVGELSGGQRRIVLLLLAAAFGADLLLLDEFTTHLDSRSVDASIELIDQMTSTSPIGVVYATHDTVPLQTNGLLTIDKGQVTYERMHSSGRNSTRTVGPTH